jgi:hypothetical protein
MNSLNNPVDSFEKEQNLAPTFQDLAGLPPAPIKLGVAKACQKR